MTTVPSPTVSEPRAIDDALRARVVIGLSGFKGPLIGPDSPDYDRARTVWNAMVDKHPGLIVRCTDTEDVVTAVNAARRLGVAFSVRGGGHSVSGKAHTDGGMTIDLSLMRQVQVVAEQHVVHAEGGCLLADVDEATEPHGLVVPTGTVSETGLGGLALGGGAGWLTRKHGLTCDNFLSLEVVLASGEVLEVSPAQHPDLFWALRGGGGNFGIVTRFTLQAHPFGPAMRIGVSLYRPQEAKQALREYAAKVPSLPRTVSWHGGLKRHMPPLPFVPDELVGERLMMLFSMWLDDADDPQGVDYTERLAQVGEPCLTATTVLPFGTGMQKALDPEFADGHRNYTKEAHLTALTDEAIDRLVDFWATMPMRGEAQVICLGGAINDVPEEAAAFSNRGAPYWLNLALHWDDPACDDDYIGQIRNAMTDLTSWTGPGAYINALNADESDRVVDAYGGPDNYARLGRIKALYDPGNFFRVNHNIAPVFT
ncbi:FAD-binding oxidoreductase [Streptomyces sp. TRM66268-LWL]|uniref:FAD-binding oxidoreductase n=1 Tax=Streptomyces polyasparticus TaxID=2767826 RepID=A0ABR7SX00_9ACTN|nr:FAD-binding oxidoreductase [Streptomyces polyasparticus]MBC9719414.1 FAD-binding oxidoreductase [Streptomyces polyasparticus]